MTGGGAVRASAAMGTGDKDGLTGGRLFKMSRETDGNTASGSCV